MAICLFDFIVAPACTSVLIAFYHAVLPPWQSLTLSNGGIMHIAFGTILGVSAWGRTKENINGPYGSNIEQEFEMASANNRIQGNNGLQNAPIPSNISAPTGGSTNINIPQ